MVLGGGEGGGLDFDRWLTRLLGKNVPVVPRAGVTHVRQPAQSQASTSVCHTRRDFVCRLPPRAGLPKPSGCLRRTPMGPGTARCGSQHASTDLTSIPHQSHIPKPAPPPITQTTQSTQNNHAKASLASALATRGAQTTFWGRPRV